MQKNQSGAAKLPGVRHEPEYLKFRILKNSSLYPNIFKSGIFYLVNGSFSSSLRTIETDFDNIYSSSTLPNLQFLLESKQWFLHFI